MGTGKDENTAKDELLALCISFAIWVGIWLVAPLKFFPDFDEALAKYGQWMRPWLDGPTVQAVPLERVWP
jgi:hypothetical protein